MFGVCIIQVCILYLYFYGNKDDDDDDDDCGAIAISLRVMLMGTCQLCSLWSVVVHSQTAELATPHLCRFARYGPCILILKNIDCFTLLDG